MRELKGKDSDPWIWAALTVYGKAKVVAGPIFQ
jgi:hypothetical protein